MKSGFADVFDNSTYNLYNPLCKQIYGKLSFICWRRYTDTVLDKITKCDVENTNYFEEDSSEDDEKEGSSFKLSNQSPSPLINKHFVSKCMTPLRVPIYE